MWPVGTAWSPRHGDVGLGADMVAGYQAGTSQCRPRTAFAPDFSRTAAVRARGRPATVAVRSRSGRMGGVIQRPATGTIPDAPGSLPVPGRRGPGDLRGQGQEPALAAVQLLPEPGQPAAPHGPDGGLGRDASSGSRSATTSRRSCSSTASSSSTSPASTSACGTTRATRSWPSRSSDEWPRAMVRRGTKRQGQPLLRPLRPRLRHPRDPRPAAAHLPHPDLQRQQVRPPPDAWAALPAVPHREVLPARASARSTASAYARLVDELRRVPRRRHRRRSSSRLERRDARGRRRASSSSGRPGCATGSASVRKAIEKQQMVTERAEDLDVFRHRRGRAGGGRAGVLRAAGPGGGAQGVHRRQGRGPVDPPQLVADILEQHYAEPSTAMPPLILVPGARGADVLRRGWPAQRRARRTPPSAAVERVEWWAASERTGGAQRQPEPSRLRVRSGCPSGARSGPCSRRSPATPRRSSPATGSSGPPTTTPGPRPSTPCRTPSTCPRPRCASSATT